MAEMRTFRMTPDTALALARAARIIRDNGRAEDFLEDAHENHIDSPISRLGLGAGIIEQELGFVYGAERRYE